MSTVRFSLSDYQSGISAGMYAPPEALCPPYYEVDPVLYRKLGTAGRRGDDLRRAMEELRKRTGPEYFDNAYPLQARTLDYSARSFPAYRFILPEVMTEDWLAIVDWGKFHRDHVLHQPLCGYIVLKLLGPDGPVLPCGKTLLDVCVDRILSSDGTAYVREFLSKSGFQDSRILGAQNPTALGVWRAFFREAAYVAAVFHDLGYPWHYAERMHANLDGMNAPAIKQNRSASQVLELFGHRLVFHALQGYQTQDSPCPSTWRERVTRIVDRALAKTHGLPGALGFLHLNDCVRRYPHPAQLPLKLLCVEWAAVAIMMHDMVDIYWGDKANDTGVPENPFLRLSFDKDPLSAIVTLADVIQEFSRPAVTYAAVDGQREEVILKYKSNGCLSTAFELDSSGELTLRYEIRNSEMRALKRSRLADERRKYFCDNYGYLNMSELGISSVRMSVS